MAKQVRGIMRHGDDSDNLDLIGTTGADVILGYGGNDFFDGLAGSASTQDSRPSAAP